MHIPIAVGGGHAPAPFLPTRSAPFIGTHHAPSLHVLLNAAWVWSEGRWWQSTPPHSPFKIQTSCKDGREGSNFYLQINAACTYGGLEGGGTRLEVKGTLNLSTLLPPTLMQAATCRFMAGLVKVQPWVLPSHYVSEELIHNGVPFKNNLTWLSIFTSKHTVLKIANLKMKRNPCLYYFIYARWEQQWFGAQPYPTFQQCCSHTNQACTVSCGRGKVMETSSR